MQKAVFVLFLMFFVLGISVNTPLLLADGDNSSGTDDGNNSIIDNPGSSDDDNDKNETEIEDEEESEESEIKVCCMTTRIATKAGFENKTRYKLVEESDCAVSAGDEGEITKEVVNNSFCKEIRERERTREIRREGNCTIKVEKKIVIENGKRVEVFKKKVECADGTREEVKIKIENRTEDGRFRERIKYEVEDEEIEVEAEDEIKLEEETNGTEYRLKARLRNGNITYIKIMPDEASEIAIERLRALNFTVELREKIRDGNIPYVVYNIKTNKHGRFLGVFKLSMRVEGEVDPETGEFIGISKPWWAFLVSGEDSDQTGDNGTGGGNENQTMVNLSEQNSSDESGTATLEEEDGQVTVLLNMVGFPENVSQPAHIHTGSCLNISSVKYPLTNVLNGESETTVNVTLDQLESQLPLAINVHQSAENASVYVSCGDLQF